MRIRKLFAFALVLVMVCGTATFSFGDAIDIEDHWAKETVQRHQENGIVNGYTDGSFRPDQPITRAEFVSILNKYFNLLLPTTISFTDVPDWAWYYQQVQIGVNAGYIAGYPDNTFRPNEYLTRQQASVITANVIGMPHDDAKGALEGFSDKGKLQGWSFDAVNSLVNWGILSGYPDNTLRPENHLTRAEALVLLDSMDAYRKAQRAMIQDIDLFNGSVVINLNKNISGLTIDDFSISAELDGMPVSLENLSFDSESMTLFFDRIGRTNRAQLLKIEVASDTEKLVGLASSSLEIRRRSTTTVAANTAPTTPVITKLPSGNVSVLDSVTISALSTDAEGDPITYIWSGKLADGSTYTEGKQVITVKAVDSHGAESASAALVFFVTNSSGTGGVLLTSPNSRIYENGIEGATITNFTFNVPYVAGHGGSDYAFVKGLNVTTQQWEFVPGVSGYTVGNDYTYNYTIQTPVTMDPTDSYFYVSNGIYLEGDIDPGLYSRLEFFYYASHCMYNNSNITYTVDFSFADYPADAPEESSPSAIGVTISGIAALGETVTGEYVFLDSNGDREGYIDASYNIIPESTYQWYRADDENGTNLSAISGATNECYTISTDDAGKYLTFVVVPLSITGTDGTLTGSPVSSPAIFIPSGD